MIDAKGVLNRLAASVPADLPRRKLLAGPHLLDLGGEKWLAATDCKAVLFFGPMVSLLTPAPEEVARQLSPYFPLADGPALWEGPADALKAWCGPAEWSAPCEACKGAAVSVPEYVTCSLCEGDELAPDPRPGYLCGLPVDRNRLACLLGPFEGDCRVGGGPNPVRPGEGDCVWAAGAGLRAVLMCLTLTAEDRQAAPRFPEGTP